MSRNDQPYTSIDFVKLKLALIRLVYMYVHVNIQNKFSRKKIVDFNDT